MPKILEENTGIMRVHAGTATYGTGEISLAYSLNGAPVITFEDGTTVYWEWEELIAQACTLKNS